MSTIIFKGCAFFLRHMQFPQTIEYALRVMVQLSIMRSQGVVRSQDLVRSTRVPPHFLSKILRRLVRKKLLTSYKGAGGGFILARPLNTIRLVDIMSALNYHIDEKHCIFGWPKCSSKAPCPLHDSVFDMKTTYRKWATSVTLEDIVKKHD